MCVQNWKFVALPVPEIIGGRPTQRNWAVPGYAHAPISQKFLMGFCPDGPCECSGHWPNLNFVALPIPGIIAMEVLGGSCEPPILGKRRP